MPSNDSGLFDGLLSIAERVTISLGTNESATIPILDPEGGVIDFRKLVGSIGAGIAFRLATGLAAIPRAVSAAVIGLVGGPLTFVEKVIRIPLEGGGFLTTADGGVFLGFDVPNWGFGAVTSFDGLLGATSQAFQRGPLNQFGVLALPVAVLVVLSMLFVLAQVRQQLLGGSS